MTDKGSNSIRRSHLVAASPVYYGWVVLVVGTLGSAMTSPGQTYAGSVFIDHFIADLGLSRSLVSTLYSAGTLAASFALPFIGRQFDRRGARLLVAVSSLLLGLACVYMGLVRNALMLGLGFFLLRLLGQGSLSLVSKNAINQWWVRRRGMAMGISGLAGAALGMGCFPMMCNWLIGVGGWREAYQVLGAMLLLGMFPLGWIFMRNRPEEHGLEPDGGSAKTDGDEGTGFVEEDWTLAEALRTPAFWVVAAGLAAPSLTNTGLHFHIVGIFKDSGLSSTLAASVFIPIAITGALTQLISGVLTDRVPIRFMLGLTLAMGAAVMVWMPRIDSVEEAIALGVLMGVQNGIEMIIGSVVWAQFFGRRNMGSIAGLGTTLCVGASALGPMPFGIARDLLGNYSTVLTWFALLPLLLSVAALIFAKRPAKG